MRSPPLLTSGRLSQHYRFQPGGRAHGRELDHWLEAERIIKAREMDIHAADTEGAASKSASLRGLMQEGMRQKK